MFAYLLLASTAVQSTSPAPQPVPAAAEKKICRTMPDISTRIGGKRICRTRAEWDAIARQTVDDLRYRGQSSR